jgi:hypothetical protein
MAMVPIIFKKAGLLSEAPKVEAALMAYPSIVDRVKPGISISDIIS